MNSQQSTHSTYRLVFDPTTDSFHDNNKVKIKVPGFGDTSSVEYLNPGLIYKRAYLNEMVDYFVDREYKRGKTIRAAPYDWRLAAGMKHEDEN